MHRAPKEIEEKGFYRAGLRCEKMLAEDSRTKSIPVIIHSVIDIEEIEEPVLQRPQVFYIQKDFKRLGELFTKLNISQDLIIQIRRFQQQYITVKSN